MNTRLFHCSFGIALMCLAPRVTGCSNMVAPPKPVAILRPSVLAHLPAEPTLVVTQGIHANLVGKVRFISDNSTGLVSNEFIGDNSTGIVSDAGAGIVSNHGAGLEPPGGFTLAQASSTTESLLTDAELEVLDAAGHVLVDRDHKPITATSNKSGAYTLFATLPAEDLVLRVVLRTGGQLFALKPRAAEGASQTIDVDTASSLGARYVLDTFVKQQQNVADRLPAANASDLHDAYQAARALLPAGHFSYEPADLLATATALDARAPGVHEVLQAIKAILLAGQANLGNGRLATTVALSTPRGVVGDGLGGLYVSESLTGRIRHIDASGHMTVYAGSRGLPLVGPTALVRLPDGTLLVADTPSNAVRKVAADGTVSVFAGDPGNTATDLDVPAAKAMLHHPAALALAGDGSVSIGELSVKGASLGRVLQVDPAGTIHLLTPPATGWATPSIGGLAVAPDASLYVLDPGDQCLHHRKPDGSWEVVGQNTPYNTLSTLALGPDGALYESDASDNLVRRLRADRTFETFAGTGGLGSSPDGTPAASARFDQPSGIWFGPDGSLYVANTGNGLVQAISPVGPGFALHTVAGTTSPTQVGLGTNISIGGPAGVAIDPQGRVVVSEGTGDTLKRLDGQNLDVIAGSNQGPAVDGVPALQATFDGPAGIAFDGAVLYVVDTQNNVLRRIDADGIVKTLAGCGHGSPGPLAATMPALSIALPRALGLAIGPDHLPYVSDNQTHRIWRIRADGQADCVAGLASPAAGGYAGDGGDLATSQLNLPSALVFSASGDLYVSDSGNSVIRKIAGASTQSPTISTYAGTQTTALFAAIAAGHPLADGDGPASSAAFYGLGALAFDGHGDLYTAEAGTADLEALLPPVIAASLGNQLPRVGARIRRITPDGQIHLVAGAGTTVLNDPDDDDVLSAPTGLIFDPQGRLIISDGGTNQLKLLTLPTGS